MLSREQPALDANLPIGYQCPTGCILITLFLLPEKNANSMDLCFCNNSLQLLTLAFYALRNLRKFSYSKALKFHHHVNFSPFSPH